jgi:hypothetical protein
MSASIWQGGSAADQPVVNSNNTYKSEYITATADGQKVFNLTKFAYGVSSESIQVLINGIGQIVTKDYTESSGTSVTLVEGAVLGDIVQVRALVGSDNTQSAAVSAANAAASAQTASDAANSIVGAANTVTGTSASNITVGTGVKVFAVGLGKQFQVNQFVMVSLATNPSIFMIGQVTGYAAGNLTINVTVTLGAGTYTNWLVSITGQPQPVIDISNNPALFAQIIAISTAL